jgi:hypothetical protein
MLIEEIIIAILEGIMAGIGLTITMSLFLPSWKSYPITATKSDAMWDEMHMLSPEMNLEDHM